MGQSDILNILIKSKLPMSGKQIAEAIGESWENKVNKIIKKMRERDEIKCVEINRHQALKYFGSKRKLRVYYLNQSDFIKAKRTVAYL